MTGQDATDESVILVLNAGSSSIRKAASVSGSTIDCQNLTVRRCCRRDEETACTREGLLAD